MSEPIRLTIGQVDKLLHPNALRHTDDLHYRLAFYGCGDHPA